MKTMTCIMTALLLSGSASAINETSYEDDNIVCMAQNIYHEARGDNYAGQIAVADVVLNRVEDSRYPNTICGVIKQAKLSEWWLARGKEVPIKHQCQFSWYCDGKSDKITNQRSWNQALAISYSMVTTGIYAGITEGATHYHATYVDPYWASSHQMQLIGPIGDHVFYKWK
jgi:N-acetylmuramoyl-L-alanine amidase